RMSRYIYTIIKQISYKRESMLFLMEKWRNSLRLGFQTRELMILCYNIIKCPQFRNIYYHTKLTSLNCMYYRKSYIKSVMINDYKAIMRGAKVSETLLNVLNPRFYNDIKDSKEDMDAFVHVFRSLKLINEKSNIVPRYVRTFNYTS